MQYFTPEPYRGTEPKNETASADGDKTLWQHLMDRPRQPTITTARSAALNGLDDSLLKEINDVLRQTADNGGMATDGTTTKEVTFYPPLTPMSAPRKAYQIISIEVIDVLVLIGLPSHYCKFGLRHFWEKSVDTIKVC